MSDYFERVEGHLLDAVERHANRGTRQARLARDPTHSVLRGHPAPGRARRRSGPALGAVAVALSTVFALALAVAAVTLIGHGRAVPGAAGSVPAGARALVAELRVLRRPQSGADKVAIKHVPWVTIVPSLTRLASILPNGRKMFLYIERLDPQKAPASLRRYFQQPRQRAADSGYRLGYSIGNTGDGPVPGFTANTVRQIRGPWVGQPHAHRVVLTGIIPDGVARVRWVFTRPDHHSTSVLINVTSNIASASIDRVGHGGLVYPSQTTWYAADGRPIKTIEGTTAP